MTDEEKIIRVKTLEDFDLELGRDGDETLEVPACIAEQYGFFLEDMGSEEVVGGSRGEGKDGTRGPAQRDLAAFEL